MNEVHLCLLDNHLVRDAFTNKNVGRWLQDKDGQIHVFVRQDWWEELWQGTEPYVIDLTLTGRERLMAVARKGEDAFTEIDDILAFIHEEQPGCKSDRPEDIAEALGIPIEVVNQLLERHYIFCRKP